MQDVTLAYGKKALPKMPSLAPKNREKWVSVFMTNPLHIAYTNAVLGAKIEAAATYLRLKGNKKLANKVGNVPSHICLHRHIRHSMSVYPLFPPFSYPPPPPRSRRV
jgi:hypothetical protein